MFDLFICETYVAHFAVSIVVRRNIQLSFDLQISCCLAKRENVLFYSEKIEKTAQVKSSSK